MTLGNGENTVFWYDAWLDGIPLTSIAPDIIESVPEHIRSKRTVAYAMMGGRWLTDFKAPLTIDKFLQLLNLWEAIQEV